MAIERANFGEQNGAAIAAAAGARLCATLSLAPLPLGGLLLLSRP